MTILKAFAKDEPHDPRPIRSHFHLSLQDLADRAQADIRAQPGSRIRRDFVPPAPLTPSDDPLKRRLAEELAFARRLLKTMGEELAADTICLVRHQGMLQRFDQVEQMLGHVGDVVGAAEPCEAVGRIGMLDLRNRLNRAGIDGGEAPCSGMKTAA